MSEVNTVCLSVETYSELRDFMKEISAGKTLEWWYYYGGQPVYSHLCKKNFVTTDEAVKSVTESNKALINEMTRLRYEITELKNPSKVKTPLTAEDFEKMSIFQFIKYRMKKK